jgi:hypothetical protein
VVRHHHPPVHPPRHFQQRQSTHQANTRLHHPLECQCQTILLDRYRR